MKQNIVVRSSKWFRSAHLLELSKTRFQRTLFIALVCLAVPILMVAGDTVDSTAVGTRTVEGLVRDIACPLQNKKSTSTSYSKDCITMCARLGSPLGILTSEGSVYVPVTESIRDTGQDALKPFGGKHWQATGKGFE